MLRSFFILLSKARWAQRLITRWGFSRRAASRFFAGETREEAIAAIRLLNQKGLAATLDHLGENTSSAAEAGQAVEDILAILDDIHRTGVKSNVSIKLTQIGLLLDPALCQQNLVRILSRARDQQNFVRIDMEDSHLTELTLDQYFLVRKAGFENTGVVIQSYLYRSAEDIAHLMEVDARVRLVKGAYLEPAAVAYPQKADVDASFDRLVIALIEGAKTAGCPEASSDGRIPPIPAIASHDLRRIDFAKQQAQQAGLQQQAIEFQMLYGIRRDLQEQLVAEGYPVRVYVPYGTHWYPYYMRRLAERPANIWFILSSLFREGGR